jgi:hypothetical protein
VAFLVPASVRAASSTWDGPPVDPDLSTERMVRAGPFHIRPFVLVKDIGYDDNVRFESQAREGDATATAGGGLDALVLAGDRGGVRLFQEFDYVAFQTQTSLNHWNGSARARGILLLKRLQLSLEDQFRSERERPSAEIDQRLRRENNALTAALKTLGLGRLGVEAWARDERIDYATDDATLETAVDRLNRDEATLSVAGQLRLLPKTTFLLEGRVVRIQFDNQSVERDARKRAILPGVRFLPSASIQGELRAGPLVLEARDRPGGDYRGLVGEGNLSTRLGRAARLKGTFARDVQFSTLTDNLYYVGTSWSGAFEQYFSRRLSGEISYGSSLNHYPMEVTRSGVVPFQGIRDDRFRDYRATVRYRPNPRMTMEASAWRLDRDSTDDFYDRVRNLFTIGSTFSF